MEKQINNFHCIRVPQKHWFHWCFQGVLYFSVNNSFPIINTKLTRIFRGRNDLEDPKNQPLHQAFKELIANVIQLLKKLQKTSFPVCAVPSPTGFFMPEILNLSRNTHGERRDTNQEK